MKHQPNPADIKLENGKALVIVGPQGSGKSILARAIAEQYGSYVEAGEFFKDDWRSLLTVSTKTVIFDELTFSENKLTAIRNLVCSDSISIRLNGEKRRDEIPTPNFIFCSGDAEFLKLPDNTRRFWAVEVGKS